MKLPDIKTFHFPAFVPYIKEEIGGKQKVVSAKVELDIRKLRDTIVLLFAA